MGNHQLRPCDRSNFSTILGVFLIIQILSLSPNTITCFLSQFCSFHSRIFLLKYRSDHGSGRPDSMTCSQPPALGWIPALFQASTLKKKKRKKIFKQHKLTIFSSVGQKSKIGVTGLQARCWEGVYLLRALGRIQCLAFVGSLRLPACLGSWPWTVETGSAPRASHIPPL